MKTQSDLDINGKFEYAENYLISLDSYSEDEIKKIKRKFAIVKSEMKRRWLAIKSRIELFEKKNENWLNGAFDIPKKHLNAGRPQKCFEDASKRSKRRKTEALRKSDSPNKIIYAAQMELKDLKSFLNAYRAVSKSTKRDLIFIRKTRQNCTLNYITGIP